MAPGDPLEVADLTVGMILEAQDDRGVWYRAKVKRVCEERGAKVHYMPNSRKARAGQRRPTSGGVTGRNGGR